MPYSKPSPSAGLVAGGMMGLIASGLIRYLNVVVHGAALGEWWWLPASASAGCVIVGAWRFLDAFDQAARNRWESHTVAAAGGGPADETAATGRPN